jgi:hypothetical protein
MPSTSSSHWKSTSLTGSALRSSSPSSLIAMTCDELTPFCVSAAARFGVPLMASRCFLYRPETFD